MKIAVILLTGATLLLAGCEREARRFTTPVDNTSATPNADRVGSLQPALPLTGQVKSPAAQDSPYESNAFAVNQGKRLFRWYNCNGCHSNGGGGIGPALMDSEWKYGSDPVNIYRSITQGRPEGMPSFGGHIPDDQVWQLVAYVQSMGGRVRKDVAPSRADALYPGPPENARPETSPRAQQPPSPSPQPPASGVR